MSEVLNKIRSRLTSSSFDAIIVTRPENRFYASGFTGSAGTLLITLDKALLLTDFRYTEQAAAQAPAFQVQRTGQEPMVTLKEALDESGAAKVAYEAEHVTVSWLKALESLSPTPSLEPTERFIESIRAVKTPAEIEKMARAAQLADEAFIHILGVLRPGVSERDIALEMEFFMRKHGSRGMPFEIIVASGLRSSMPHGVASGKVIETGDLVTMDFGAVVDGYCSDMTRTVVIGKASEEQRSIYDLVLKAHTEALKAFVPGAYCQAVDAVARDIITEAGHGEHFGHGLGHGVGVVVHEMPRLSRISSDDRLVPGNVVSNEPGVYIPGWGGVRIEDLIAITDDGHRNLNSSTKELIEIR